MLVRPTRAFPGTLFLLRGSALSAVWPQLVVLTGLSVVVTELMFRAGDPKDFSLTTIPFSLIGLALSIFLGFRNNACYDRWWEARKLWGSLINTTRSLARQTLTLTPPGAAEQAEAEAFQAEMVRRIIGFAYGLKYHLRTEISLDAVQPWVPEAERAGLAQESNVPFALTQRMGERYREAWQRGWLDSYHMRVMEESLTKLTDIQGGCERIKNTPVPLSYTMLTHRLVALYCIALPFGIAGDVGHLTPLVVLFISYAFLGLDSLGTQLEDPFEVDANDLPLAALARTIEINLLQRIGVKELPEPTRPVLGILS